jgi:DNA-binding transcriptional MocR family regulator
MDTIWAPNWNNAKGPKYLALHDEVRKDIEAGKLVPGDKLPPVRELAWKLGITPGTVARAYQKGIDDGFLNAVVGRGTFVADAAGPDRDSDDADIDPVNLRSMRTPNVGQDKAIQQALLAMSKRPTSHYAQYPEIDDYKPLKQALCDWLLLVNLRVAPEDIVLSYGAQNGMIIAMSTCLSGKKPVVLCEDQVYFGVRQAAELLRADLVGIEMDSVGMRPEALELACRETGAAVLITSSNAHNPTTLQTSHRRRLQIAEIARRYDLQIIDDDCWGNEPSEAESYHTICRERYWYV